MTSLSLEFIGTFWQWSGDLAYLNHPDGREATIGVDSIGHTFVDIRRVPADGSSPFHVERVDNYRALNGAAVAAEELVAQGFGGKRSAPYAHRVRERDL